MADRMENILNLQSQLMIKVPHDVSPEMQRQITAGIGVIEETLEYLNSIGKKPWRPNPLPREQQLEELTDILFFYAELILLSTFSWEEVAKEYRRKHAINLKRYEKGKAGDYSWDDKGTKGEL